MRIQEDMNDQLKEKINELLDSSVDEFSSVGGGDINQAGKVTDKEGQTFFVKWNDSAPDDMFPKEEKGLTLLRSAESGLQIPKVIGTGSTKDGIDFILMTFIKEGSPKADSNQKFGEKLAKLHQNTSDQYGLDYDNYIGRLPQSNTWHDDWIDFFVSERLEPQVQMAFDDDLFSPEITNHFQRLYKNLPDLLPDEPASLLHGDLWSGNYHFDQNGRPVILDPAVYYGHREIEIAYTRLFGGFSAEFYSAYQNAFPLEPNFGERTDIYNIYPLLVHTNMFGPPYPRRVKSIIQQF
jgi:fructosamine-3-kinase